MLHALLLTAASFLTMQDPSGNLRADGQQAYLFAYPLVLMDATMRASGGVNPHQFNHTKAFPDPRFRVVVRPNADTLYSLAWLDLRDEPVLMRVPDTKGRYYMMQILDAWTETVSVPGKRTTGTEEKWFAITGPEWTGKLPANVQQIQSATNLVWIIGRVQTNGPADYTNVHAIQKEMRLMPLSRYPDGASVKATSNPQAVTAVGLTPPEAVDRMTDLEFFNRFLELLAHNPGHTADLPFLQKLAAIGLKPGATLTALPENGFSEGVQTARKTVSSATLIRSSNTGKTKWSPVNLKFGRFGVDYLLRALVARAGLGANPPEEAVYLSAYVDGSGKPLGSVPAYKLHFEKGGLPPVNAFWSIALYDSAGYFAENPAGRYSIGDRDPLVYNSDGSLDLYLQRAEPAIKSNWLPTPASGNFALTFRLYWPRESVLNGSWTPPPVLPAGAVQ